MATNAKKIVIIDDDEAVRDSLRALLESYGYAVEEFTAPEAFLRGTSLAASNIGCVILDLHMPGMGGVAFLEQLRTNGSKLPVIVITGRSDSLLRKRIEAAGVVAMLDKPVDDDALLSRLALSMGST